MCKFDTTPDDNADRLDVVEAKLNVILMFTGGQFVGFVALIITLISQ